MGGLLRYLYGPGKREEHTNPHLVAAWDGAGPLSTLEPPVGLDGKGGTSVHPPPVSLVLGSGAAHPMWKSRGGAVQSRGRSVVARA